MGHQRHDRQRRRVQFEPWLPLAAAGTAELGEFRGYAFLIDGVVLRGEEKVELSLTPGARE